MATETRTAEQNALIGRLRNQTTAGRTARLARIRAAATPENIARTYGVAVDVIRQQYTDNAAQLREMASKATATGRKVNGYTAEQLAARAADFEDRARSTEDTDNAQAHAILDSLGVHNECAICHLIDSNAADFESRVAM